MTSSSSTEPRGQYSEELVQYMHFVESYKPTIPESVAKYYLEKSGCTTTDPKVLKLVSLAADKFLAETVYEAKEQSLLKANNPKYKRKSDSNPATALDIYDVEGSLSQANIFWRRSLRRKTALGLDGIQAIDENKS
jgi:hypothetical protein